MKDVAGFTPRPGIIIHPLSPSSHTRITFTSHLTFHIRQFSILIPSISSASFIPQSWRLQTSRSGKLQLAYGNWQLTVGNSFCLSSSSPSLFYHLSSPQLQPEEQHSSSGKPTPSLASSRFRSLFLSLHLPVCNQCMYFYYPSPLQSPSLNSLLFFLKFSEANFVP